MKKLIILFRVNQVLKSTAINRSGGYRVFIIAVCLQLLSYFSGAQNPLDAPNTTFVVTQLCARTNVTRSSEPPSSVEWFWQRSSNGTDATYSATTYTEYASVGLYLRPRQKQSPYTWGASQFVGNVVVSSAPCGHVELTGPVTVQLGEIVPYQAIFKDANGNQVPPPTYGLGNLNWLGYPGESPSNIFDYYSCSIQWLQIGTYTLYYEISSDDPDWSDVSCTLKVTVLPAYPNPIISATSNSVLDGAPVILSVDNYTYTTYQWLDSKGQPIAGATGSSYSASLPGNYRVRVMRGNSTLVSNYKTLTKRTLSSQVNYVSSKVIQVPDVTTTELVDAAPAEQTVQYFDDISRPLQTVKRANSPLKSDIVQPFIYDQYGREYRQYLPVTMAVSDGLYKSGILQNGLYAGQAANFYSTPWDGKVADDTRPLSETIFESSPLNRVVKQGAPGATWQPDQDITNMNDKSVKKSYLVNETADLVMQFAYDQTSGIVTATTNGTDTKYYDPGQLTVNKTTDEHNNEVIEYIDLEGHTILKRVQYKMDASNNKLYASTYYIYDDFGDLVVVLPPEAIKNGTWTGN